MSQKIDENERLDVMKDDNFRLLTQNKCKGYRKDFARDNNFYGMLMHGVWKCLHCDDEFPYLASCKLVQVNFDVVYSLLYHLGLLMRRDDIMWIWVRCVFNGFRGHARIEQVTFYKLEKYSILLHLWVVRLYDKLQFTCDLIYCSMT